MGPHISKSSGHSQPCWKKSTLVLGKKLTNLILNYFTEFTGNFVHNYQLTFSAELGNPAP